MQRTFKSKLSKSLAVSALALAIGAGGVFVAGSMLFDSGAAIAQSQSGQGQGGQGQGGQGQGGQGQGGQTDSGQGQGGQSGAGASASGQGQGGGGQGAGGQGDAGRPAWAQEGIPAVDLGRLSVARSPDQVLDRALAEALSNFTPAMAAFYELSLDEMIIELSLNWDTLTIIDSPLQNLALMKDLLADGVTQLPVSNSTDVLLAVFLGVASDKTLPISTNTVIALSTIMGYPITGAAAEALAADAEDIRTAVLAGHG